MAEVVKAGMNIHEPLLGQFYGGQVPETLKKSDRRNRSYPLLPKWRIQFSPDLRPKMAQVSQMLTGAEWVPVVAGLRRLRTSLCRRPGLLLPRIWTQMDNIGQFTNRKKLKKLLWSMVMFMSCMCSFRLICNCRCSFSMAISPVLTKRKPVAHGLEALQKYLRLVWVSAIQQFWCWHPDYELRTGRNAAASPLSMVCQAFFVAWQCCESDMFSHPCTLREREPDQGAWLDLNLEVSCSGQSDSFEPSAGLDHQQGPAFGRSLSLQVFNKFLFWLVWSNAWHAVFVVNSRQQNEEIENLQ